MSYTDPDAPKSKPIVDGGWIRGMINKYWAEQTTQGAILIIYRVLVYARLTNGEWDYGVNEDKREHCYGMLTWKKGNGDIVPKIRQALESLGHTTVDFDRGNWHPPEVAFKTRSRKSTWDMEERGELEADWLSPSSDAPELRDSGASGEVLLQDHEQPMAAQAVVASAELNQYQPPQAPPQSPAQQYATPLQAPNPNTVPQQPQPQYAPQQPQYAPQPSLGPQPGAVAMLDPIAAALHQAASNVEQPQQRPKQPQPQTPF